MPKPISGTTHIGERLEHRPNGDIYAYKRVAAYHSDTQKPELSSRS